MTRTRQVRGMNWLPGYPDVRDYTMDDLDVVKTIKRLLEEEHLTSEGVRVRLEGLNAGDSEGDDRPFMPRMKGEGLKAVVET